MRDPDVIIIGGGQSGLVMSRAFTAQGIDHVILERGRIGERWHSERWRSLHLLTTNAHSALPGLTLSATDPEGFTSAKAFASYLGDYAYKVAAPVIGGVEVAGVERVACGYRVSTSAGRWHARVVVIATGACDTPYRPTMAASLANSILQMTPSQYREPAQLPEGGVLVVGASATGAQLAEEIHASGRPVVLAVGDHTRVPRRYRGRDIFDQLANAGILDEPTIEGANLASARRSPSLQLVGGPAVRDLNIGTLHHQGIRLVGRLTDMNGTMAAFGGDLAKTTGASHKRMVRTLDRIDAGILQCGAGDPPANADVRKPLEFDCEPLRLDLHREGIRTVMWAAGYRRDYSWLKVPVVDAEGEIIHTGGVTASPGLYVLGLVYLRRRRSSFINGCGLDADDLAPIVRAHLDYAVKQVA